MLGLGFAEMLVLFAPFAMLFGNGYVPGLLPTPAVKTVVAVSRASAFAYADKSKGGKVSVQFRAGVAVPERCADVKVELTGGTKPVPLKGNRLAQYYLSAHNVDTFTYTARGVPPGAYQAVVTMSLVGDDGTKREVKATEAVTVP